MKRGAEQELCARYADRVSKAGRPLGLGPLNIREYTESRAQSAPERKREETSQLLGIVPPPATKVALDETGKQFSSREFADFMARERDQGCAEMWFFIGGADGHDTTMLDIAGYKMSLGRMTWPHQIARALLAEQIYRATTILSGHPYHRD